MSSIHVRPLRDDLAFGARVTGITLAVLEDEQVATGSAESSTSAA